MECAFTGRKDSSSFDARILRKRLCGHADPVNSCLMFEPYRKAVGSDIWHFCSNCRTWPLGDYIASFSPEQSGVEGLCAECIARHQMGECKYHNNERLREFRTCSVIIQGKTCGRELTTEIAAGVYVCSLGHRILIIPPVGSKKST